MSYRCGNCNYAKEGAPNRTVTEVRSDGSILKEANLCNDCKPLYKEPKVIWSAKVAETINKNTYSRDDENSNDTAKRVARYLNK